MTAARIFISYRTSDGVDKATALARELNATFGDEQVFLDKEDLPAGLPWREAVGSTLGQQPILLLIVTPQALDARIADADDPVRKEITTALDAGAHLIPLLADGVDALPDAASLPEALRGLNERTWRRLRAYDWREDVERLIEDLQQLGLKRLERTQVRRDADRRRWLQLGVAFGGGVLAGGALGAWWSSRRSGAGEASALLSGAWLLRAAPPANENGSRLDAVTLHLTQAGEDVKLYSEPIDITRDPAWAGFARQWRQRFDQKFERVVWRGAGTARLEAGSPPTIDIALRVETPAGSEPLEGGNLSGQASADGRKLIGRVWMNGEQAERAIEMVRQ